MPKIPQNKDGQFFVTSLKAVSQIFNVSPETVSSWRSKGMPGDNRRYVLQEISKWRDETIGQKPGRPASPPPGVDDPLLSGDSPALERYRLAKAKHAELDLEARKSELVERDKCREILARWAVIIRRMGERLGKRYGKDAAKTVNRSLDECDRVIEKELSVD